MKIVKTNQDLKNSIKSLKEESKNITEFKTPIVAFVPTMGALHKGHISLVEKAKKEADIVIASIFVNPTQFKEGEDFGVYPRVEAYDCNKLEEQGIDIAFIPEIDEIYSDGVKKDNIKLQNADILEGESREGFFYGVATVVNKLFDIVKPDKAYFGEKDYQQLQIIKQISYMREDNIEIISVATKRESSGLALSSRNLYLSSEEKEIAPYLYKSLCSAKSMYEDGLSIDKIEMKITNYLIEKGFSSVDYISIRKDNLEVIDKSINSNSENKIRILAAAYLGNTRLIDNIE